MSDVVHVTKLVDYLEVIFDFKDFESTWGSRINVKTKLWLD